MTPADNPAHRERLRGNDYQPASWPTHCASCGSPDIYYDPADGWSCNSCHKEKATDDP